MAIVTISRGTLSGGESLARCLAERLNLPLLSREALRDAACRYGIAEKLLAQRVERTPTVMQRRMAEGEERRLYLIAMQAALAERAWQGGFVYDGHAGHLLLQGVPCVLRVRLIAPMAYRIGVVREGQGLDEEDAKKYIRHVDRCRALWTELLYQVDWQDPTLYDLVIQLGAVDMETACTLIDFTVRTAAFRHTPETRERLADFVLGSRIRLKLAQNPATRAAWIEVRVWDGVAWVSGEFPSGDLPARGVVPTRADIHDVIRTFPEIREVEFELKGAAYRSAGEGGRPT